MEHASIQAISTKTLLEMLTDADDRDFAFRRSARRDILYAVVQTQAQKQTHRLVLLTASEDLARRCERNWQLFMNRYSFAIYQIAS